MPHHPGRRPAQDRHPRRRFLLWQDQALKDVDLAVPANAVTAIIGPSGCGKSTLLRAINRIYELYPEQRANGEILIDGRNVLERRYSLSALRRASAWCSRSRRRSRPASATTSPSPSLFRAAFEGRAGRPDRGRAAPGGAVGRGQGQAERQRAVAVGRTAAALVHRPHPRGPARRLSCSMSRPRRSTPSPPRGSRS